MQNRSYMPLGMILLCLCLLMGGETAISQDDAATILVRVKVGSDNVPLLLLPDPLSPTLMTLGDGEILELVGRTPDNLWVYVMSWQRTPGWVQAEMVEPLPPDMFSIPVAEVLPDQILNGVPFWNFKPFMHNIYEFGQTRGNRADFFAKVGDSITASQYFLYPISYGAYELGEYGYLQAVLDHYGTGPDSPFARDSYAAKTGWTAGQVLDSANAGQGCFAYESPLRCEYRNSRPAVALIMLGTNDIGYVSLDDYTTNIGLIVNESISAGVIPVLSTIPELPGQEWRVREFNHVIIQTATIYQVPLWNYWYALRSLPNYGISEDGIHPSLPPDGLGVTSFSQSFLRYGFNVRNLTALQSLDLILRNVIRPDEEK